MGVPYPVDLREKIEIDKETFVRVSIDIDYSEKVSKEQICYALNLLFEDILKRFKV